MIEFSFLNYLAKISLLFLSYNCKIYNVLDQQVDPIVDCLSLEQLFVPTGFLACMCLAFRLGIAGTGWISQLISPFYCQWLVNRFDW